MANNIPYQKYVDCGYFRVIEQKFSKPNGDTAINIKTLVYQKGINFIKKTLDKELSD
ncbi:phage antirepressor KilAC domain-containing protein [uncultured Thomasclavelia sp.]|uniref:phage antirepressor KilAC domain-containing protein n=1 Tax=uncultured Thomasclavelia sp. TaxID=3025759 RepID=UPI00260E9945|nr:phage antirepressor KilAC domain-containing protein [uncultured Thomasclavelia sp.]